VTCSIDNNWFTIIMLQMSFAAILPKYSMQFFILPLHNAIELLFLFVFIYICIMLSHTTHTIRLWWERISSIQMNYSHNRNWCESHGIMRQGLRSELMHTLYASEIQVTQNSLSLTLSEFQCRSVYDVHILVLDWNSLSGYPKHRIYLSASCSYILSKTEMTRIKGYQCLLLVDLTKVQ
jgi:hypothetical protein